MGCSAANFDFPLRAETFGWNKTIDLRLPTGRQDCRHFYGEYYVFFSCLGLCDNVMCPITRPVKWNSCPGQLESKKIFTVDEEGHLTFLIKQHNLKKPGSDFFVCQNTKCVSFEKVCNLDDDCGDFSDELMCVNHFKCESSGEYLPTVQKCDGTIHCADKSDECNESCGREVVSSMSLKVVGWMIGITALILNSVSLFNGISSLKTADSEPAFLNKSLVILVGVGDQLIGFYLIAISISDLYYSDNFCIVQLNWLASGTCVSLGIVSTFGSQLSLFSMASLSLLRVSGTSKGLSVPEEKTKRSMMKLAAMAGAIILASASISSIPIMRIFEDFFVNGIKYKNSNSLFIGCPGKTIHMEILQAYYGRIMADSLTWSQIKVLVDDMFSKDYGGISRNRLSFYGNDPTCLFKYFVRREDPQKSFVLTVLILNLVCFIVITCSYITIVLKTKRSAKRLQVIASANTAARNPTKKRNAQLQRVTQWIILTDFICWVPFIIICCLHFLERLDAKPWYSFFSLVVLPINSVVNPLLYDVTLRQSLYYIYTGLKSKLKTLFLTFVGQIDCCVLNTARVDRAEEIELAFRPQTSGTRDRVENQKQVFINEAALGYYKTSQENEPMEKIAVHMQDRKESQENPNGENTEVQDTSLKS